jgi:GNAT superfamily N-acetyltransferase
VARDDLRIRPWSDFSAADLLGVKRGFGERDLAERSHRVDQYGDEWFIATVDDRAVGWIVVKWRGKSTHPEYPDLEDIYVQEPWRSRGIGTALIFFAEDRARRRGNGRIGLAVNPTQNVRAGALYERLGYVATGEDSYLDGVYDGDEDWVIDVEKWL